MEELRLALRRLTKRSASTLASVAALGSAIGATAVNWSALSAVLVAPLPLTDSERLLVVGERRTRGRDMIVSTGFIYPKLKEIRAIDVFEQLVAQWASPHTLLVKASDMPARADVGFATHDFFEALGIRAVRLGADSGARARGEPAGRASRGARGSGGRAEGGAGQHKGCARGLHESHVSPA